MRTRVVIAGLLLLFAAGVIAQTSTQDQSNAKPKKVKAPKPKKLGPQVIILAPKDASGATHEESTDRCLYAKAGLLNFFEKKKFTSVSPAEVQGTIDQLGIDYTKTENLTPDNLDKLATPWQAQYVATVTLLSVDEGEPSLPDSKHPVKSITASVHVSSWLYDVKNHIFVFQDKPSEWQYTSKKGEERLDPKNIGYEAIIEAVQEAFKGSLDKPKK